MIRRRYAALCLGLAVLTLSTHSGETQTGGMPAQVEQKLREMGRVVNPPETTKLYSPLHQKEPYAGVRIVRDIRYGPDERQALDVFVPEQAGGARVQSSCSFTAAVSWPATKKARPAAFTSTMLASGLCAAAGLASTSRIGWPRRTHGRRRRGRCGCTALGRSEHLAAWR